MKMMTRKQEPTQQPRHKGKYDISNWGENRICKCGHSIVVHLGQAPHGCANEDKGISGLATGEICDCQRFIESKQQPQDSEEWEERFERKFDYTKDGQWLCYYNVLNDEEEVVGEQYGYCVPEEIKDFIRAEIEAARTRGIEEGYKHGWEYSRYANRKHEIVDRTVEEFFRYDSSTNLVPLTLEQLKQKYLNK